MVSMIMIGFEVYNRNGVVTARAVTSHRMPKGTMFMYHAQDKHIETPGSEITDTRGDHIMHLQEFT